MDDRERVEEQVEDLETPAADAEEVKGGAGVTAMDDWESPVVFKAADGNVRRGGWDGNHNATLIRI